MISFYDRYPLSSTLDYARDAKTRYYYLEHPDYPLPDYRVPLFRHGMNFAFVAKNGVDVGFLLHAGKPTVGTSLTYIDYEADIKDCFDIVFIANGEACAQQNYEHLCSLGLPNRIHRVDNVLGRNAAYKAAARISTTRYFFAVFAKLRVESTFDFSFGTLPFDRRHYVFEAFNPLNGLQYGHQAMILYNREQVLVNPGKAIDFTMGQPYRGIARLSGVALFNYSAIATYRTTFREVCKLMLAGDASSMSRITQWLQSSGQYGDVATQATMDAMEYVSTVKDPELIKADTYDWSAVDKRYK